MSRRRQLGQQKAGRMGAGPHIPAWPPRSAGSVEDGLRERLPGERRGAVCIQNLQPVLMSALFPSSFHEGSEEPMLMSPSLEQAERLWAGCLQQEAMYSFPRAARTKSCKQKHCLTVLEARRSEEGVSRAVPPLKRREGCVAGLSHSAW